LEGDKGQLNIVREKKSVTDDAEESEEDLESNGSEE
jgi:hypothetical protein